MLYGELIPLCLDYFFFFASEIQQIRNKKTHKYSQKTSLV